MEKKTIINEKARAAIVDAVNKAMPEKVPAKTGRPLNVRRLFDPKRRRVGTGNSKTGIPSVNILPGDKLAATYAGAMPGNIREMFDVVRGVLAGYGLTICGSCSGTCPGCYALKITRFTGPALSQMLNTLEALIDPARYWALVRDELSRKRKSPAAIRVHDAGDWVTPEYFAAFMEMATATPWTWYTYSKEAEILEGYGLDKIKAAKNIHISCSPWPGYCEPIGDLAQFCYDDGTNPELKDLPHCPAVLKDGSPRMIIDKKTGKERRYTCADCMHCPNAKPGDKWAVYAH